MTFQNFSVQRALWGDVKKNVHFEILINMKMSSLGRKMFQQLQNVSRCARLGDVDIFLTKLSLGDLHEKINFQNSKITCALIFQTNFLRGDLDEHINFQIVLCSNSSPNVFYHLGSKD